MTGIVGLAVPLGSMASDSKPSEPRLLGRWKSDTERTMNAVPVGWSKGRVEVLQRLVGRFEWQFTTDALFVLEGDRSQGAQRAHYPYQVVASDERSVVLMLDDLGKRRLQQIFFEGEYLYSLGGYVEYFRKAAA